MTIVPLPAPALATSPGSLLFAAQPQGMASPPQSVTVSNSGPGALNVTGLQLGGSAPADFYVSSSTCAGAIPAGSSCQVTVRFAPMAQGPRSAALVIASDDPASPASVSLSGSGTPPPQGPAGNPGARGPQGANGKVELVRCKTVTKTITKTINHKRQQVKVTQLQCTARLVTGPIKFTTAGAAVKASISRGSVLYATGVSVPTGAGHSQVILRELRRLRAGRYTLTLRHRRRILRREITIT